MYFYLCAFLYECRILKTLLFFTIFFYLVLFLVTMEVRSILFNFYFSFLFCSGCFIYATLLVLQFCNYSNQTIPQSVSRLYGLDLDVFSFQLDGVSISLIWLTSFICLLCLFYNYNAVGFSYAKYNFLLIVIELVLICCFVVKNLLSFYVLFEAVLIPMFLLIGLGSRGRKIHANYYFFFFTFASSILLLLGVVFIYYLTGSLNFETFEIANVSFLNRQLIFYVFFFGFAAKIPLLPLHIWLPEAHVEAPTIGSVILAAILLKLGAYGMYRVVFPFCDFALLQHAKLVVIPLLILSTTLPALAATRQIDLKKIVAYSSVVHMSFSLLGLFSQQGFGVQGFLFLLISHGLISAAMFFCVGMLYDRFHTRNVVYYGGLVQFMPLFSIFYFLIIFSNMSFPGTCNFIGEFAVLYATFDSFGVISFLIIMFGLFATVLFCLILLYKVIFYQISNFLTCNLKDLNFIEFLILSLLTFYILLFGIMPNLLLSFFIL